MFRIITHTRKKAIHNVKIIPLGLLSFQTRINKYYIFN